MRGSPVQVMLPPCAILTAVDAEHHPVRYDELYTAMFHIAAHIVRTRHIHKRLDVNVRG